METITHPTLVQLVAAGAVRVVVAVGQPGGWSLLVRYGLAERALAAQRSKQVRVFRKLDTLVLYLRQIGVSRFEVDAVKPGPKPIADSTGKPDRRRRDKKDTPGNTDSLKPSKSTKK